MNQQTNDYDNEWTEQFLSQNEHRIQMQADKLRYKQELKNLINVKNVWNGLDGIMDYWEPMGVFDLQIMQGKNIRSYEITAKIKGIEGIRLERQTEEKKVYGFNHYFVWQTREFPESYHGIMAIPLSNNRYFVISYNC